VARLVKLLDPNDRMAFAEEVAAVGSMTSSCVATALLELVNGVEVALRQVTHRAKPRRPGGSQPRSGPGLLRIGCRRSMREPGSPGDRA